MNRTQKNKALYRERLTILLVVFFCMLISGSERFFNTQNTDTKIEQNAGGDHSSDEQTFVNVAVSAVVPFATTVAQNTFYLIYEILGFETEKLAHEEPITSYSSYFLEILLTRIISPNAP
ncbi:hypothetical protein [Anditalea andensis]|uniref:Uncharacterized protein n=1 Tax=Anditalea andensis TaxID=1048983 RepID=A0A074LHV5_9BACT|nr:hypothetical protein [Anditalea andensis]KEO73377.1 hypothetical protein EL17_13625 [Anditalea andensis]